MRILLLLTLLVSGLVQGQSLEPLCPQCPDFSRPPRPETGFWYDAASPGVGLAVEVQKDTLAAVFFGFTPQGSPVWYTMSGTLTRSEVPTHEWVVEGDATRFAGGSCLGCAHRAIDEGTIVARVRVEFVQRGLARVLVNGEPWVTMTPLVYGVPTLAEFAPSYDHPFPRIDGPWVLVFQEGTDDGMESSRYSRLVEVSGDEGVADGLAPYLIFQYAAPLELVLMVDMECEQASGNESPLCTLNLFVDREGRRISPPRRYVMPIANVTDARFKAEAANGFTIEGFRIDHD